jgi:hypothetical protein
LLQLIARNIRGDAEHVKVDARGVRFRGAGDGLNLALLRIWLLASVRISVGNEQQHFRAFTRGCLYIADDLLDGGAGGRVVVRVHHVVELANGAEVVSGGADGIENRTGAAREAVVARVEDEPELQALLQRGHDARHRVQQRLANDGPACLLAPALGVAVTHAA